MLTRTRASIVFLVLAAVNLLGGGISPVAAATAIELTAVPASLNFTVNTSTSATSLSQTVLISDGLNGTQPSQALSWTLQSTSAAWLEWAPASGTSAPPVTSVVTLNPAELQKLVPGKYSGTVTLAYQDANGSNQTLAIAVSLDYRPAYVSFVSPYIGTENQPGTLVIRGMNFTGGTATAAPVTAVIGSTEIGPITPDDATQVRVNYPAMPAGAYPVTIKNAAGLLATNAKLVVLSPPTLTYQAISAPSVRQRLIYDAERQTLYGVNRTDQLIESYSLSGGAWVTAPAYSLPNVTDLALWPNGQAFVALATNGVYEIPLSGGAFVAQLRVPYSITWCGQYLDRLVVANDGKTFVISRFSGCSGDTPSYLYDVVAHSFVQLNPLTDLLIGNVGGGADGSELVLGHNDLYSKVLFYSADTHRVTESPTSGFALIGISVSGNASRVILDQLSVLDGSITHLGSLPPAPGAGVALASRDSARAYSYRDDMTGGGPRLEVYDLNGVLQPGNLYPLLKTVPLADSPNTAAGNYGAITLAETPDGTTVFVSGNSKILVVPVN